MTSIPEFKQSIFTICVSTVVVLLIAFSLSIPLAAGPTQVSGSVKIVWDPSPESDVVGYLVHYGSESGVYTQVIDVGPATAFEITGLIKQNSYFCAVTAYNTYGMVSDFAKELVIPRADIPQTDPDKDVTIDITAPVSRVTALPAAVKPVFDVAWSGNDGNGSGIARYTVYVSENTGTTWRPWLADTALRTAPFTGTAGKRYRFNVIAKDWVGNVQTLNPTNATADTLVVGGAMIVVQEADGTVVPPDAGAVAFGKVKMGKTVKHTLTIRNRGPLPLSGLGAALSGIGMSSFKVEGVNSGTLAAGSSTTITVIYKPKDTKAHAAVLRISSSDIHKLTYDIKLTRTGRKEVKPEIAIQQGKGAKKNLKDNKSSKDFGVVKVKKSSKPVVFTIKNVGTASLKKVKVTLSGKQAKDFKVVRNPSKSVKPGKSTQFKVVYKPGKPKTSKAKIKIVSNDKDENTFRVKLAGKGKL